MNEPRDNAAIMNRDYVGYALLQRAKEITELRERINRLEVAIAELIRKTERGAE